MPTRFDFERAFVDPAAGLKPACRHLLHVLAMRLDRDSFTILPRYQPSITELARDMGCDRKTAVRRLDRVEAAGWVIRDRPTKHDARTKHARTRYTLRIPGAYLEARGITPRDLGAEIPQARGEMPPGLGAELPEARGKTPPESSRSSGSSDGDGDLDVIIEEITRRTGRPVGKLTAARIRDEIYARGQPRTNAHSYLRTVIQREPDPSRWLPTRQPPPYREVAAAALAHTE